MIQGVLAYCKRSCMEFLICSLFPSPVPPSVPVVFFIATKSQSEALDGIIQ